MLLLSLDEVEGSKENRLSGPSQREMLQQMSRSIASGSYREPARQPETASLARSIAYSPSLAIGRDWMPVSCSRGNLISERQPPTTSLVDTLRDGRWTPRLSILIHLMNIHRISAERGRAFDLVNGSVNRLSLARHRSESRGQLGDRLVLEEQFGGQGQAGGIGLGHDLEGLDRGSAQCEEVVVDPHRASAEGIGPDRGEALLDRRAGRDVRAADEMGRDGSGLGRDARSTFPDGFRGSASRITIAAGTIAAGSSLRRELRRSSSVVPAHRGARRRPSASCPRDDPPGDDRRLTD